MQLLGPCYVAHGPRLQYWVDKRITNKGVFLAFVVHTYAQRPWSSTGNPLEPVVHHGDFPTLEAAKAEADYQAGVEKVTQLLKGESHD